MLVAIEPRGLRCFNTWRLWTRLKNKGVKTILSRYVKLAVKLAKALKKFSTKISISTQVRYIVVHVCDTIVVNLSMFWVDVNIFPCERTHFAEIDGHHWRFVVCKSHSDWQRWKNTGWCIDFLWKIDARERGETGQSHIPRVQFRVAIVDE